MSRMKGITPIISVIVLLLIAVALAGAAWTYISGFTSAYTSKVIDLPPSSSYFDGRNVKIMLRNIGTSAISTGSCSVSGPNNNTVTCGDITITREGSAYDVDIRPSASSISPGGSITMTDYNCQAGNVKYIISSPTSTYQIDVSANTPCSYPTDPVSWWKFDGDAKDSAGSNHGTVYGATWVDDAERGKVASFDGDEDYVDCGNSDSLNISDEITISVWINSKQAFGNTTRFDFVNKKGISWSMRNDERENAPHLGAPGIIFHAYFNDSNWYGVGYRNSTPPLSIGTWYYAVAVYDTESRGLELWVNGELIDSNTSIAGLRIANAYPTEYPVVVGSSGGTANFFNGTIDDVMIFKRALSPEEIKALYNSQKK